MSKVVIETERLRLRVPDPADRATLQGWFGDPRVMINLGPVRDADGTDAAIARHDGYRDEGLGFWMVERRGDGVPVGFAGLKRCNPGSSLEGRLEIGWMYGVPFWGQGYAVEAARASLDWGWNHCPDPQIVALTARVNDASQRVMQRIGMSAAPALDHFHSAFEPGDRLRNTVVYAIDRPAA